jgi:hypothetical protein|tara:strand:- start:361 stop:540 length:180 start_codon:yes stop_codon:yes gene_type:complete
MQIIRKTSSRQTIIGILIKIVFAMFLIIGIVFLLNKIDFPTPKKDIEKIISNENFKIIK